MTTNSAGRSRTRRILAAAGAAAIGTGLVLTVPTGGSAAAGPTTGIVCETSASNTFSLDARAGYINTPDGNSIYSWGYAVSGGAFQLPGPTLCVESGATVTVVLHNKLPEPVSIVFPGQTDVTANGSPAAPQSDATGLTSLVQAAAATSGVVTYTFTAGSPGTYLYESGTDVSKQREMGLYGGLVVRPAGAPNQANSQASSTFDPAHEYLFVLSEIDPALHSAVERKRSFDYTKIRARYFLINGRSMPDTLAPNFASWLPSQPYGALIHIQPFEPGDQPALIRYVNAGAVNYPFHPHGNNQRVITRDGAPAVDTSGTDSSYEKFLIDVGPGQSVDTLDQWTQEYDPDTNPIPSDIQLPQLQDQIVGPGTETWFSENPYLGGPRGDLPAGIVQNNECGEYYHVAHSHALDQATNYGASFGGMMTLIRIDPRGGCPSSVQP
jgi:FtsP/CotA-like multicopper oxidase with cupredoxin domain